MIADEPREHTYGRQSESDVGFIYILDSLENIHPGI